MLAQIVKIIDIAPIEGADKIEAARILGYWSVIKKGEYKPGDLVCFVFGDTLLPRKPWNQFLWPKGTDENGPEIRLKTCKFRGQVSQGLILPISLVGDLSEGYYLPEGYDVTDILGVKKYEKQVPAQLAGQIKGGFPNFIPKTDQLNICTYPEVVAELCGRDIVIHKKYDGTSTTIFYKDGEVSVCSRNFELKEEDGNLYWKMAKKYNLPEKLRNYGRNIAFQMESVGPGVNGNKMQLKENSAFLFDVWDIDGQFYWDSETVDHLAHEFEIPRVDRIYRGPFDKDLNFLKDIANNSQYEPGVLCEGIVVRGVKEAYSETLRGRLSGKVISERFLLKYGE